jgi:hypothetical protein
MDQPKFKSKLKIIKAALSDEPYIHKTTISKEQFLNLLTINRACKGAIKYVQSCKTPKEAWNKCVRYDWMDWLSYQFLVSTDYYPVRVSNLFADVYGDWVDMCYGDPGAKAIKKAMAKELRTLVPWETMESCILKRVWR